MRSRDFNKNPGRSRALVNKAWSKKKQFRPFTHKDLAEMERWMDEHKIGIRILSALAGVNQSRLHSTVTRLHARGEVLMNKEDFDRVRHVWSHPPNTSTLEAVKKLKNPVCRYRASRITTAPKEASKGLRTLARFMGQYGTDHGGLKQKDEATP